MTGHTPWPKMTPAGRRQARRTLAEYSEGIRDRGVSLRGMQKVAHDPGDPLITSHCPFCGSGQVVGRSDGTIMCDFCGQNYIVRVQSAFPGIPQMPMGPGAPSDIGPDGGVLPPDAIGPDGLPAGGMGPDDGMGDEGAPPFGDDEEGAGPPDDGDGPPPPGGDSPSTKSDSKKNDSGSKKDKGGKSKKESAKVRRCKYESDGAQCGELVTQDDSGGWHHQDESLDHRHEAQPWWSPGHEARYRGFEGQVLTEDQYIRHLAVTLSAGHPAVMAALRADTSRGRRPFARQGAGLLPEGETIRGDDPDGISFRYHSLPDDHVITAHHPDAGQVGHLYWTKPHIDPYEHFMEPGEVRDLHVHPDYRGQGIARRMWDLGRQRDPGIQHSYVQSDAGRGFAGAVGARKAALRKTADPYDEAPDWRGPDGHEVTDYTFTRPPRHTEPSNSNPWRQMPVREQYNTEHALRQQMAAVFPMVDKNHVGTETGHRLWPLTDAEGRTSVTIGHPNMASFDTIKLHLGTGPGDHFGELMRQMRTPEVMRSMGEQMRGIPQTHEIHEHGEDY